MVDSKQIQALGLEEKIAKVKAQVDEYNKKPVAERKNYGTSIYGHAADPLFVSSKMESDERIILHEYAAEIIPNWWPYTLFAFDNAGDEDYVDAYTDHNGCEPADDDALWKADLTYRLVRYSYEYDKEMMPIPELTSETFFDDYKTVIMPDEELLD